MNITPQGLLDRGAGGMATVYLAEDLKHQRKVAVKVLRPDLAASLGPERFLRDVKPENVMLSDRHALVTDFGVAKAVSAATGRQSLTTAGVALGTPAYMSPEQAAADRNARSSRLRTPCFCREWRRPSGMTRLIHATTRPAASTSSS